MLEPSDLHNNSKDVDQHVSLANNTSVCSNIITSVLFLPDRLSLQFRVFSSVTVEAQGVYFLLSTSHGV